MDELEEIKRRKMIEMLKRASSKPEVEYPMAPVEVTDKTFEEFIKKYPLAVIDCWAAWCGPCRMVAPTIEELARDYMGKCVFGKLNVDENPRIASIHGILSIPTLLISWRGEVVDRIIGAVPRIHIEAKLRSLLDRTA